jgi:hypothetical protein
MRMSCESRFPLFPGFLSLASPGIPHLTTIIVGVRCPFLVTIHQFDRRGIGELLDSPM